MNSDSHPPVLSPAYCRDCHKPFLRTGRPGRPIERCLSCRSARRSRSASALAPGRPEVVSGRQVVAVIEQLADKLYGIEDLVGDPYSGAAPLEALYEFGAMVEGALTAAVVEQARERGLRWGPIGKALYLSGDTVRKRWTPERLEKKLAPYPVRTRTAPAKAPAPVPVVPRQQARTMPATREAGGQRTAKPGGTPPADRAQDPPAAEAVRPASALPVPKEELITTMSALHRASGLTLKAIAHRTGVVPSYLTHILAGKRVPSWPVTRDYAIACGADPAGLRVQWEATRAPCADADSGARDAAAVLHNLVCDLHRAAARPAPSTICEMSTGRIATRDVAGLIDDGRIPDWHTVRHVVTVLRGQPAAVEALWARARSAWSHATKTSSTRIPLGALG